MADFDFGYPDVTDLNGNELFLLVDPATQGGLNVTVDTLVDLSKVTGISDVPGLTADLAAKQTEIDLNLQKVTYPTSASDKLATIEAGADVTDTDNVESALGISPSGNPDLLLSQRGTFVEGGGGGTSVTKSEVDFAIGASPTGDSAQFYNEQGNFIDAEYDSVENAPITRNATVETITIAGTRTNVQAQNAGTSEFSTITMLDSFNPVPTQYTSIFTSPNTSFTPALVLPTGSQGRQLSLTELDGTVHRFAYTTNGNYRLLDGGLTGTVRLGASQQTTTATLLSAVSVPDQTAGQSISLVGDETGVFSVGDFISPLNINFGAYRGIFIETITFDGTNTVITGTSNGAVTFNTTSTLYLAGPADEIQGSLSTFSIDPDTSDAVYSSSITSQAFTDVSSTATAGTWNGSTTALDNLGNITGDSTFYDTVVADLGTGSTIVWVTGTTTVTLYGITTTDPGTVTFASYTTSTSPGTTFPGSDLFGVIGASFLRGIGYYITTPTPSTPYITQVANATVGLETAVTQVGGITTTTLNGLPAVSVLIDWATETNIDSSYTITGGLNNMNTIVNTDGVPGVGVTVATTVTVIDPEATEVASQTFGVTDAADNNVDAVGNFINDAVNNNTETPIDFVSEYGSGVLTLIAQEAGNTNPWTIAFNNNGATAANQGNLSTSTVQTGVVINEIDILSTSRLHGINDLMEIKSSTNASTVEIVPPVSEEAGGIAPSPDVSGTLTITGAPTDITLNLVQPGFPASTGWTITLTIDGVATQRTGTQPSNTELDESVTVFVTPGVHTFRAQAVTTNPASGGLVTLLQGGVESTIRLEPDTLTLDAENIIFDALNGIKTDRITSTNGDNIEIILTETAGSNTRQDLSVDILGTTWINLNRRFQGVDLNSIFIGSTTEDVDFNIQGVGKSGVVRYDAGNDDFYVHPDTTLSGALPPAIPTADGEYKLVIASGVATWEII